MRRYCFSIDSKYWFTFCRHVECMLFMQLLKIICLTVSSRFSTIELVVPFYRYEECNGPLLVYIYITTHDTDGSTGAIRTWPRPVFQWDFPVGKNFVSAAGHWTTYSTHHANVHVELLNFLSSDAFQKSK